jgi:hypothetical protein
MVSFVVLVQQIKAFMVKITRKNTMNEAASGNE